MEFSSAIYRGDPCPEFSFSFKSNWYFGFNNLLFVFPYWQNSKIELYLSHKVRMPSQGLTQVFLMPMDLSIQTLEATTFQSSKYFEFDWFHHPPRPIHILFAYDIY